MAATKKIIQKDAQGNVIEVDIGANATNITQDSTHRFVTDAEKTTWNAKQSTITIDTALSSSSTNPVQNKVVNTALAGKASSSHTHSNYVNQNAFSNVTVGSTTIAADSATDTLTLVAGSNVNLVADATNDKVTISATDTKYTHPSYTSKSNNLYKVTIDGTGHVSAATAVTKADITNLGIPATDTKYTHPTTSGNKHIPAGGIGGQILQWSADGTATWADSYYHIEYIDGCTTGIWEQKTGYYVCGMPCYRAKASDAGKIFIVPEWYDPESEIDKAIAVRQAFKCIDYIKPVDYGLYVYCYTQKPAVSFSFFVYVIRQRQQ